MLSLLLASLAFAGDIVVETTKPVIVLVDGEAVDFPEGSMTATASGLGDGDHLIEVRNLLGRRVTELRVELAFEEVLKTSYKNRLLAVLDKYAKEDAPKVVEVAPAVEEESSLVTLADLDEELPKTIAVGSVAIMLPASAEVTFDGNQLEYAPSNDGFVATEQLPGTHDLAVNYEGVDLLSEEVSVVPGENYRCVLVRDRLECEYGTPVLGLPEIDASGIDLASLGGEREDVVSNVGVVFALSDAKDFSKVFIDGAKAVDFGQTVDSQRVELTVGVHVVEIRGFDDSRWFRGKLTVGAGQDISFQYNQNDGVNVSGDEVEWEAY
jgi:hypothetical protein